MIGVEFLPDLLGQQLHGNGDVREVVVPQNGIDMLDLLDLFLQCRDILGGHILENDKGERALAEVLFQKLLPDDRIHVGGQIIKHIIVDARADHAQHGRDHQQQRDDQNGYAALDDRFGKFHAYSSLSLFS